VNVTEDKDFKQLVRAEARRTGRRYSAVREELRPGATPRLEPDEVRQHFDGIVKTIETWCYGKPRLAPLVATALLFVRGNVLVRGMAGNGMTALGQGVTTAIGGHLVSIDGRTGLDETEIVAWREDDVVIIGHFDGLNIADQVAVLDASHIPAVVLAKVHPIAERMPFPPDDDNRERFILSVELGPADQDMELRIINEYREHNSGRSNEAVVNLDQLAGMRAAAQAVDVPEDVRRFVVEFAASVRADPEIIIGVSTIAMLALVEVAAAVAAAAGRQTATIDDVR
jgi:hypothetical protein